MYSDPRAALPNPKITGRVVYQELPIVNPSWFDVFSVNLILLALSLRCVSWGSFFLNRFPLMKWGEIGQPNFLVCVHSRC